ncbi:MAG: ImmA/IrrE family metallo-endopeptidase [Micrococcales bacterium]|nr:ImmA/IrrE family metallo-endopeptidase [Micrococcales bacterium]
MRPTAQAERQAAERAGSIRRDYGLGTAPIGEVAELVATCAQCDVTVMTMPVGVDGVIARDPRTRRSIVAVAATDAWARQRMTLAHELGHLVFDRLDRDLPADCAGDSAAESQVTSFGRHLLAPRAGVSALLERAGAVRGAVDESHLSQVVVHYGVSPEVAAIQMRDEGWTHDPQAAQWIAGTVTTKHLATRYGWAAEHECLVASAQTQRPPARLLRDATDAYVAGKVSVGTVAAVLGKDIAAVRAELDAEGIEPQTPEVPWFDFNADV